MDPLAALSARLNPTPDATQNDPEVRLSRLRTASVEFESILSQQMFQDMQKTLGSEGIVGSGLSGSVYSSMFTQAVSKAMAESEGLGVAKKIYSDVVQHDQSLKKYAEACGIGWETPKGIKTLSPEEKQVLLDSLKTPAQKAAALAASEASIASAKENPATPPIYLQKADIKPISKVEEPKAATVVAPKPL